MVRKSGKPTILILLLAGVFLGLLGAVYFWFRTDITRSSRVILWLRDPDQYQQWSVKALDHCTNAPFLIPTDGYIGYLWDDSFRPGHRHQGIDIFGGTEPGITPVYSVYDGFLTRKSDWKSSLILRVPEDPLKPQRQIWLYFTHLALQDGTSLIDPSFPPGTTEKFVKAGELLGYQGNYSGDPKSPVGVHLHFSIVKDDGYGKYLNELLIENTYDPSPYLGIGLNSHIAGDDVPLCP